MVPYHNSRRLLQRMCKTRTLLGVDLRPCHNIIIIIIVLFDDNGSTLARRCDLL